jgi:dienelactone hydrolase
MLAAMDTPYDPFAVGQFGVGVRTCELADTGRGRVFPVELWYPARGVPEQDAGPEYRDAEARPGRHPLVVFSHYSGGGRRTATYLCRHLASHGYVVAAMDHSEVIAAQLARRAGETAEDRAARISAVIAARVPDVRLLLSDLPDPDSAAARAGLEIDSSRIGVVGHSFGGWTALAMPEQDPLVRAVVALAPGGSSHPVRGVLPLTLAFGWERDVPVLILAGDCDVPCPLEGVQEVFERSPEPKRMFVLRRADHEHFADDVEASHEALRAMTRPGDAAWMAAAMLPASELCSAEDGHSFSRGLTLAHLDATLAEDPAAAEFLSRDAEHALAARGIDGYEQPGAMTGEPRPGR